MSSDLVQLVNDISPYVSAALSAYGAAVLARTNEEVAGSTVNLGRKILQKIFGTNTQEEEMPEELRRAVNHLNDEDYQAALRVRIKEILANDANLRTQIGDMVNSIKAMEAGVSQITASASDSARQAVLGQGVQHNNFG